MADNRRDFRASEKKQTDVDGNEWGSILRIYSKSHTYIGGGEKKTMERKGMSSKRCYD